MFLVLWGYVWRLVQRRKFRCWVFLGIKGDNLGIGFSLDIVLSFLGNYGGFIQLVNKYMRVFGGFVLFRFQFDYFRRELGGYGSWDFGRSNRVGVLGESLVFWVLFIFILDTGQGLWERDGGSSGRVGDRCMGVFQIYRSVSRYCGIFIDLGVKLLDGIFYKFQW